MVVALHNFLVLFLSSLLSEPCLSRISAAPILFTAAFIPSSSSRLQDLIMEKNPGTSLLTVHMVLAALGPWVLLPVVLALICYWRGQTPAVPADVLTPICPVCRGTPWLAWHSLVLQRALLLFAFSRKLIPSWSHSYWWSFPPPACIFRFLRIAYPLVCLKMLPMGFL